MLRGDALTEVIRRASRRLELNITITKRILLGTCEQLCIFITRKDYLLYMESTTLFSSEGALLLVMFLMVAAGFWLQRFKVFKVLGPALTVIVTGIVLSADCCDSLQP